MFVDGTKGRSKRLSLTDLWHFETFEIFETAAVLFNSCSVQSIKFPYGIVSSLGWFSVSYINSANKDDDDKDGDDWSDDDGKW